MRFVRFFSEDEPHLGLLRHDWIFDLTAANQELCGKRLTRVTQLMGHPDLLTQLADFAVSGERFKLRRDGMQLDAPIRDVPKLLALAGKFRKHVEVLRAHSEPGDVIAMGTPGGVGKARGIRLQPGDVMRAEIEG